MHVLSTTNGSVARVSVAGEVDTESSPALLVALRGLFDSGVHQMVIDASAVSFLDSAGLNVLIGVQRDLVALVIERGNPVVDRLINLTGLERLYGYEHSVLRPSSALDLVAPGH